MSLSVVEKLDRINARMQQFGIEVGFSDYTLSEYTVSYDYITGVRNISGEAHLSLQVINGKVVFGVDMLHAQNFNINYDFTTCLRLLNELNKSIIYCNSLELTIPKYGSLAWYEGKRVLK